MGAQVLEKQNYQLSNSGPEGLIKNPLEEKINYFRSNWQKEGLPYNWANLPGTGFMINKQVNLITSDLKFSDSHYEKKNKLSIGLEQTKQDIKGFVLEYLAQGLVFPIHYKIDREGCLIDTNYGNKRIVDTVSSEERKGVVRKKIEEIESFMAFAKEGSIAIMVSPDGSSGLHAEDGAPIDFPDSQTYIFQKKGNEVFGFAIRTDFKKEEHKKFLESLPQEALKGRKISDSSSPSDFVCRIALIEPQMMEMRDIKDVVDKIRDARFNTNSSLFAYKNRLWNEVYRDLERREELWKFDQHTSSKFNAFKDYVLSNNLSRQAIKEALAVTVLEIAKFLRIGRKEISKEGVIFHKLSNFNPQAAGAILYGLVLSEVQKLPGCAGGGIKKNKSLIESITSRLGIKNSFKKDEEEDNFVCPNCKSEASAPVGDTCPSCGLTKEEYAKSGGKVCT